MGYVRAEPTERMRMTTAIPACALRFGFGFGFYASRFVFHLLQVLRLTPRIQTFLQPWVTIARFVFGVQSIAGQTTKWPLRQCREQLRGRHPATFSRSVWEGTPGKVDRTRTGLSSLSMHPACSLSMRGATPGNGLRTPSESSSLTN